MKTYLQCGFEDRCSKKNCLKCPRRNKHNFKHFNFTIAEEITIENFAMSNVEIMIEENPEEITLMQQIMQKLMNRMFRIEIEERK